MLSTKHSIIRKPQPRGKRPASYTANGTLEVHPPPNIALAGFQPSERTPHGFQLFNDKDVVLILVSKQNIWGEGQIFKPYLS